MTGTGRTAALPPAGYRRPDPIDASGLVVHAVGQGGQDLGTFDFSGDGAEQLRRQSAAAFASCVRARWNSAATCRQRALDLRRFIAEAIAHQPPIVRAEQITAGFWQRFAAEGRHNAGLALVLREIPSLPESTRAATRTINRGSRPAREAKVAYSWTELKAIRDLAAGQVRAARLRIGENIAVMQRWRTGAIQRRDPDWRWGMILDRLGRTGDLPRMPSGQITRHNRTVLNMHGGRRDAVLALFPSVTELAAAAILLICHEGWNASVISAMQIPDQWPNGDGGESAPVIARIATDKPRRGARRRFASNNLVNAGEGSTGAALQQVLEMTGQARATLATLDAPSNSLLIARRLLRRRDTGYHFFCDGRDLIDYVKDWNRMMAASDPGWRPLSLSLLRHSAQIHHGRPRNNTTAVHESDYLMRDQGVRESSRSVVEAGLNAAVEHAAAKVRMRLVNGEGTDINQVAVRLAQTAAIPLDTARAVVDGTLRTPAASCLDFDHSPLNYGPCDVSFLWCFACPNALALASDLPRIVYLHQALAGLRSTATITAWSSRWAGHFARISDFLDTHTAPQARAALLAQVREQDRHIIDLMLERRLDP
jgi:hypothetical protein